MRCFLQSTTRDMCLRNILSFCQADRITRPVSKTVAVKTTSYEILLFPSVGLVSLFRGHRSRMTVVNRLLRERRQTRKAITAIPRFLPQLCVCLTDGGEPFVHGL